MKKRLAIVGAGSSGLITLKYAVDRLKDWDVQCFEKSSQTIGCWGNPYSGFTSTSTKYTTQFTCFRQYDSNVTLAVKQSQADFFKGNEYGRYLESFVEAFQLAPYISLNTKVLSCRKIGREWVLQIDDGVIRDVYFDALVICTGLTERPKPLDVAFDTVRDLNEIEGICQRTVVVVGGGESAVDIANRLAQPDRQNQVYLSLKKGVRVSPRYHPIRGVPSDFLRNRLLLSIRRSLRNSIGQKFVESRIRFQTVFERLFGSHFDGSDTSGISPDQVKAQRRKYWDLKLTRSAKDRLFNVFHTKSDGFLDAVADQRIQIVGPALDASYTKFTEFEGTQRFDIRPDLVLPMIGFSTYLDSISSGAFTVRDFYLGCLHKADDSLFLVGFARPIIGNIPTMSEMQAKYLTSILEGSVSRPENLGLRHAEECVQLKRKFPMINTETIYPVEMFEYCDRIARAMGIYPTKSNVGSWLLWIKLQCVPVTTQLYCDQYFDAKQLSKEPIFTPKILLLLLAMIRTCDLTCRILFRR